MGVAARNNHHSIVDLLLSSKNIIVDKKDWLVSTVVIVFTISCNYMLTVFAYYNFTYQTNKT